MQTNGLPPSEKQGQHGFGGILGGIQRDSRCRSAALSALPAAGPVPKNFPRIHRRGKEIDHQQWLQPLAVILLFVR